jgi:hypothetical protein
MPTPTTTYSFSKPTVGADDNAWGTELNNNLDKLDDLLDGTLSIAPNLVGWKVGGVSVTASAAELNYLDLTSLGTSQASKVVTADANGDVKFANAIVETVHTLSGTSVALDPNNGTIQVHTLTGNTTYTDDFVAGESITLLIDDGSAYTVTWPTITWKTGGGFAPTLLTTGITVIVLWKVGSTLYGARVGNA